MAAPRLLEKLMTRVMGMPYDTPEADRELALLEARLMHLLCDRIAKAKGNGIDHGSLQSFANLIRDEKSSVITFNYDDILDETLWNTPFEGSGTPFWNPDGGYGFYCRSSQGIPQARPFQGTVSDTLILKLHGSINWRYRVGNKSPHGPSEIFHHEQWDRASQYPAHLIEPHLEANPFIVPPVLIKSELTAHPVLRHIWKLAYDTIASAGRIVFIGYSFPETDLAARTLFRETISSRSEAHFPELEIVSLCDNFNERDRIMRCYRSLIPNLKDSQFHFDGAKNWLGQQA